MLRCLLGGVYDLNILTGPIGVSIVLFLFIH